MRDATYPGNADQPVLNSYFDDIPVAEAIEIRTANGNSLDLVALAPRCDHKTSRGDRPSHREFPHDARFLDARRRAIQCSVAKQHRGKQPRNRDESVIYALQRFDLGVPQGAALDPYSHSQREKEQDPDKNQDPVKVQGGIAAARHDERNRAEQEYCGPVEKAAAKRELGGGRIQSAETADIGIPIGAAI